MNNTRIQQWLVTLANRGAAATEFEREAGSIITWLAGPSGAISLADTAAWRIVRDECPTELRDEEFWWNTRPAETGLLLDDDEQEIFEQVGTALRYLSTRGVLLSHPTYAYLVRWPDRAWEEWVE